MDFKYDVIVIGAGHTGCEAAVASANIGAKTLLITMDMNKIAQMSCNPAVGGIAKGQIVREIDALGGQMGIVADKSAIQFRMLNRSKGPAMWSPRVQSDRIEFIKEWTKIVSNTENLYLWQDTVTELLIKDKTVTGIKTLLGLEIKAKSVILTAGTFLNGMMHVGKTIFKGGRISEPSSYGLTEQLKEFGFATDRMKTGTPARIDGRTIDFSKTVEQKGDDDYHKFSYLSSVKRELPQVSCWITHTNEETHKILNDSLNDSPLYNGQIQSIGPRYCPSIETKIVTFADKTSHQLFIEPEGLNINEYYLNGFSSSLPLETQIEAIHTIKGLENAQIYRPGYAIEYDFFDPRQLNPTMETQKINNLYFAGQINGTTGYEEAGGQGLIAGINAGLKSTNKNNDFVLKRNEAYIGVLIDDLINKGVDEPYRMFTSRAEYRILLRQDNADDRLTKKGFDLGLVKEDRYNEFLAKKEKEKELITLLSNYSVKPKDINPLLKEKGTNEIKQGYKLKDILLRPQINLNDLVDNFGEIKEVVSKNNLNEETLESVEIQVKYAGYIERENLIANKIDRLENLIIENRIDYNKLQSLSTEAKQKLVKQNPKTIKDARKISGVSPSDINTILVAIGR